MSDQIFALPTVDISDIVDALLGDPAFLDGILLDIGSNIDSNLLLITPPASAGDPIAIDLTVTGTGGITVTNPSAGFLNIDGTAATTVLDDGFGTNVRGTGSLVTPYRVDTLISSNSLEVIPTLINGDPTVVNLTVTGTGAIIATNPSPGVWNVDGSTIGSPSFVTDGNGTLVTGNGSLATPYRTNLDLTATPIFSLLLTPAVGLSGAYGIGFSLTTPPAAKTSVTPPTVGTPGQWQINDNLNYIIVPPVTHEISMVGVSTTVFNITIGFMKIGKLATAIISRGTSMALPIGPMITISSTDPTTELPSPSANWYPDPAFSTPELVTLQGKLQNLDLTSLVVMEAGMMFSGLSQFSFHYEPQHTGPWIKDIAATTFVAPAFEFQWICTA